MDYKDKTLVWFGTSIPCGAPANNYPSMVGEMLGATVINESVGSGCLRAGSWMAVSGADPLGFSGRWFNSVMNSLSLSSGEKQSIFNDYAYWQPRIPGAPVALSQAEVDAYKQTSYDILLDKYLTDTTFPDAFVFDHGHNEHIVIDGVTRWGDEMYSAPTSELDRSYAVGAMNFILRRILDYNPKAHIIFVGHYENQDKPSIAVLQEHYASLWEFPLIRLWQSTGWSQKTVLSKGAWQNGVWNPFFYQNAIEYTMKQIWVPDDIHPHSDLHGDANTHIAGLIANALTCGYAPKEEVEGVATNGDWIDATLINNWVAFDSVRKPAYRRCADGRVQFRGMLKNGAVGTVAFKLPSEFYPPFGMNFAVPSGGGYGQVGIVSQNVTPSIGSNAYFSLDGISYFAQGC